MFNRIFVWVWKRLSDIQTVLWLWALMGAVIMTVLAIVSRLPLAISVALIVATALAALFLGNEVALWQTRRRERNAPPAALRIQHTPDQFPFVEQLLFLRGRRSDPRAPTPTYRLHRVAVQNLTTVTITGIEVKLTNVRSLGDPVKKASYRTPLHLRLRNDDETAGTPQTITLNAGDSVWFDVTYVDPLTQRLVLCHASGINFLPMAGCEIEIAAFGRDVPSTRRKFVIGVEPSSAESPLGGSFLRPVGPR